MFNRKAYKDIAKKQLKNRWTTPVLATLFIMGIGFLIYIPYYYFEFKNVAGSFKSIASYENGTYFMEQEKNALFSLYALLFVFLILFEGVFELAKAYLYIALSHTTEPQPFKVFIKGFSFCLKGFLAYLWKCIWIYLWMLLFIIPGIIKAIAYSQMYFIIAEYPNISVRKAMQISKVMTKGFKGDLFIMELSFIGWALLSGLTANIGLLWLAPYKSMSYANAYHAMKAHALKTGDISEEDFA